MTGSFLLVKFDRLLFVFLWVIGPRFVLNLIRVFDGSFGGATLFQNPRYQSPNQVTVYDSDDLPSMCNRWFSVT